jgi:hypothetical protein
VPTFNDGDPIDVAGLNALQTQINDLVSKFPTIGADVNNAATAAVNALVKPQVYGGLTAAKQVKANNVTQFDIKFGDNGLSGVPNSVVVTPKHTKDSGVMTMQCWVDNVSSAGATAYVYTAPGNKTIPSLQLYFLATVHNK